VILLLHRLNLDPITGVDMIFKSNKLLVICGPCSLESQGISFAVANELKRLEFIYPEIEFVFKGSFDKANRTSLSSNRGTGIGQGLEIFSAIKKEFGFLTLTDVHESQQCEPVAAICDVLQIPAFLCRQTDLLVAAAATGKVVNVKKGQFMSAQDMSNVVDKMRGMGASEFWLTERGFALGYNNLVVDMRGFPIMSQFDCPVIMDATHSVQIPGGGSGESSGDREFIEPLAKSALAAGATGLFLEAHPDPDNAISDRKSQLHLDDLEKVLANCLKVWQAVR
jgi:2-dehydro-3-deoxyphosphooctonate aldolase (KDO 8-P synthase)